MDAGRLLRAAAFIVLVAMLEQPLAPSSWLVGSISGRTRLVLESGETQALAGVKVTLTDLGWGRVLTLESDSRGRFGFAHLRPGAYAVEVEKAGHQLKQVRRDRVIRVRVNDPVRVLPAYDLIPLGP